MSLKSSFLLLLLGVFTLFLGLIVFPLRDSAEVSAEHTSNVSGLQITALSYAAQPRFIGNGIFQDFTGTDARLETYNFKDQQVYVSFPGDSTQLAESLTNITVAPRRVEYANWEGSHWKLGDYIYRESSRYFFRFPASDLNVSSDTEISQWFTEEIEYSIRLSQLSNYSTNRLIYGGPTQLKPDAGSQPIANHGAVITRGQEQSLQRLARDIVPRNASDERAAQTLLNFVTQQIEYNHAEAGYSVETLKRAPEVLLSGSSDCSGTVILYASLLEQIGIDYVLVYMPKHIAVAVEGDFANQNGYTITWGGARYSIAETTAEGFQIGKTVLLQPYGQFLYLQPPGLSARSL